ncbi:MAG: phage Tail Collar domain protein [Paenibacillus sp.]|jgi:microcystin-dependent protein|nr:phage Tail Collar domain protein [Paenibacillus sp.]
MGKSKIKKMAVTLALVCMLSQMFAVGTAQASAEPFVGEIEMFAFNFAPVGFMLCDGATLPISQNTALFSLLGTTYGGDGQTNFQIPDLRGASPMPGVNYYIAVQGVFPSRP